MCFTWCYYIWESKVSSFKFKNFVCLFVVIAVAAFFFFWFLNLFFVYFRENGWLTFTGEPRSHFQWVEKDKKHLKITPYQSNMILMISKSREVGAVGIAGIKEEWNLLGRHFFKLPIYDCGNTVLNGQQWELHYKLNVHPARR